LGVGAPVKTACEGANINPSTYYDGVAKSKENFAYAYFAEEVQQASAESEVKNQSLVCDASENGERQHSSWKGAGPKIGVQNA
jgi:hypothetical protein